MKEKKSPDAHYDILPPKMNQEAFQDHRLV